MTLSGLSVPHRVETTLVHDDANGFRNSRSHNQADIAVTGDSFVSAGHVAETESVVAQLEQLTGASVVNLAQISWGPYQYLAVLETVCSSAEAEGLCQGHLRGE